ncbi:hypothetical protein [Deinococcus peraridilitoris]|nr:hypothetical protein [Deinococcus peraridilitoris]
MTTLHRATREYFRWARETFGWATLVYLLFWLGIGIVTTIETVQATDSLGLSGVHLPLGAGVFTLLGVLIGLTSRLPPVTLNRRDVYRLALAPIMPAQVLAWPLLRARAVRFLMGLCAGGAWALLAPMVFGVHAPLAPLALALVLTVGVDIAWLNYAAREGNPVARRNVAVLTGLTVVLALLGSFSSFGLASALYQTTPWALLAPVLLLWTTISAAKRTQIESFPRSFVEQSLILGQLQAVNLNAGWLQGDEDPDVVHRLRAQLRGDARAIRPSRFLPPPGFRRGVTGALIWRGLTLLWRRPMLEQAVLALRFSLTASLVLLASGNVVVQGFLALSLAKLAQRLLVSLSARSLLPMTVRARTLGRATPGSILTVLLGLIGMSGALACGFTPFALAVLRP